MIQCAMSRCGLALPGKAAVIGFLMGGAASLTYAARMPDIVAAVVTYYPATYFVIDPEAFVAKSRGPTLVFAGGRDTYKNCCLIETARKLAAAGKSGQGAAAFEVVEYPQADHGFIHSGKTFRASDANDAMRRTLEHLKQNLGDSERSSRTSLPARHRNVTRAPIGALVPSW